MKLSISSPAELPKTLLIITPSVENTTENPSTKNTVFKIIFVRLIVMLFVPFFRLSSVIVVPERYAKNAGIIGSMHGATKEPNPASAATARVTSVIMSSNNFYFKGFFQIFSLFATIPFYSSPNYL
ncbi:MAG: hypothetical protein NPMRTHETA2_810004 [Nitrosopumilales archaeon]|nr:MAG: hypothetical protein NPMRTHETA2_810004 [Nitrosopumilales archaeon]